MSKSSNFEIKLSDNKYSALSDIRGLQAKAHYMVMSAAPYSDGKWVLCGTMEHFDALLGDLEEEISCGSAPKRNIPSLQRIFARVMPLHDNSIY
ncbi:MAG: hypothetical protein NTV34_11735 [Proteobacteria bacterium]|nr:hypothetical protein [Pseudomonadota bacterium]